MHRRPGSRTLPPGFDVRRSRPACADPQARAFRSINLLQRNHASPGHIDRSEGVSYSSSRLTRYSPVSGSFTNVPTAPVSRSFSSRSERFCSFWASAMKRRYSSIPAPTSNSNKIICGIYPPAVVRARTGSRVPFPPSPLQDRRHRLRRFVQDRLRKFQVSVDRKSRAHH